MTRPEWTQEEDDFLVEHINRGWSYTLIAEGISKGRHPKWQLTRNAIAGRKSRLLKRGVTMATPDHYSAVTHANKQRAKATHAQKPPVIKKEKVMTKKTPAPEEVRVRNPATGQLKPLSAGVLPMTENPKTILEIGHRQCRAAVGEPPRMYDGVFNPFLFCGAPTEEGETYCNKHAPLMYTKPKPHTGGRGMVLTRIGTNKGPA